MKVINKIVKKKTIYLSIVQKSNISSSFKHILEGDYIEYVFELRKNNQKRHDYAYSMIIF